MLFLDLVDLIPRQDILEVFNGGKCGLGLDAADLGSDPDKCTAVWKH